MTDGFETGKIILADIQSGVLESNDEHKRQGLLKSLQAKGNILDVTIPISAEFVYQSYSCFCIMPFGNYYFQKLLIL